MGCRNAAGFGRASIFSARTVRMSGGLTGRFSRAESALAFRRPSARLDGHGAPVGLDGTCHHAGPRDGAPPLPDSQEGYRTIFELSWDAIYIHDPETGAILDANQRACEMHGCTLEELKRDGIGSFTPEPSAYTWERARSYILAAAAGAPPSVRVAHDQQATPAGGRIRVESAVEGGEVRFDVSDTGKGISKEQLPNVFRRFWQADERDRRGVGLGLSVARGIVEAHGGRIWVESVEGEGSTFHFTLPLASDHPQVAVSSPETQREASPVTA